MGDFRGFSGAHVLGSGLALVARLVQFCVRRRCCSAAISESVNFALHHKFKYDLQVLATWEVACSFLRLLDALAALLVLEQLEEEVGRYFGAD